MGKIGIVPVGMLIDHPRSCVVYNFVANVQCIIIIITWFISLYVCIR